MKKLLSRIKSDTNARLKEIAMEAELAEKEILKEARKAAARERARIIEEAKKTAEQEKQRILASASLQANRERAALIDAILEQHISNAIENIDSIRKDKRYESALNKLTEKAIAEIPAERIRVIVSDKDKALLRIKRFEGKRIEIVSGKQGPGTIVESFDGKVCIKNEFAEIAKENKQRIKSELFRAMLSEGAGK